jgi:hypothetical protein
LVKFFLLILFSSHLKLPDTKELEQFAPVMALVNLNMEYNVKIFKPQFMSVTVGNVSIAS